MRRVSYQPSHFRTKGGLYAPRSPYYSRLWAQALCADTSVIPHRVHALMRDWCIAWVYPGWYRPVYTRVVYMPCTYPGGICPVHTRVVYAPVHTRVVYLRPYPGGVPPSIPGWVYPSQVPGWCILLRYPGRCLPCTVGCLPCTVGCLPCTWWRLFMGFCR